MNMGPLNGCVWAVGRDVRLLSEMGTEGAAGMEVVGEGRVTCSWNIHGRTKEWPVAVM